jgi:mitogen-activated protein kinase kinase kinase
MSSDDVQRLQWQSMLSSVLHGDVFKGEKRKALLTARGAEREDAHTQLWLGLRARLHGCTVDAELKDVLLRRLQRARPALEHVINFVFEPESSPDVDDDDDDGGGGGAGPDAADMEAMAAAKAQASAVISELLVAKSLYPHTAAFYRDMNLAGDDIAFQVRRDALYAWVRPIFVCITIMSLITSR